MTRGLVLGKFYPPHAGHHFLIETATAQCDELTVLVAAGSQESIPIELRAEWLRDRHPDATVRAVTDDNPTDYGDPAVWDSHMAVFFSVCPPPFDVVFTSEAYGAELASRYGAKHVAVDPERVRRPISATMVRADPPSCWTHLDPAVRAFLTKRVVVLGAESTGTTTLARSLAAHYTTECVPEFGRQYTSKLVAAGIPIEQIAWTPDAFLEISRRQADLEDAAALKAGPVLMCDTDPLATTVWQERYTGCSTEAVEEVAASRDYALHILTGDEIPFVQDGLRDGENLRGWMNGRFRERLNGRDWIEVTGTHDDRMAQAISAIDDRLHWHFEAPR